MDQYNTYTPLEWTPENSIIKVIGVGGGGCNAVTYMFNQNIKGCTFIVCNTDSQALEGSNVPIKIQLGTGRGAGTNPTKGRNAALESQEIIEKTILDSGTEMLFITAGMGGGTGTGAAPVIANMAKKHGILTVGVVTIPFENEGNEALSKAIDGIHELEKNVDSLLIINNQKLYDCYGSMLSHEAFPKANEVLSTAVKGIIEIITKPGFINVDFEDVKTMMKDSGMALMGCGSGTGESRLEDAVKEALESPLLNDFDLKTSKNVLVNITTGKNEMGLRMNELSQLNAMINEYTGNANNFKRGLIWDEDPEVGDKVTITVIATGFNFGGLDRMTPRALGNIIMINEDFKYDRTSLRDEIELQDVPNSIKIGYNTSANVRTFNFSQEQKPIMILSPNQRIADIENVAAIRRAAKPTHKEGNE